MLLLQCLLLDVVLAASLEEKLGNLRVGHRRRLLVTCWLTHRCRRRSCHFTLVAD